MFTTTKSQQIKFGIRSTWWSLRWQGQSWLVCLSRLWT
jgi:hypothetical protein